MKSITPLVGIVLCLAVIGTASAKPTSDDNDEHHNEKQIRHRPKRQYPSRFGYHQQQWPGYYDQRRDDSDLLPRIHRLLEDLSDFVRRPPPPPPQPIYIPYPIQYPSPQSCQCGGGSESNQIPNVTIRWPQMDDKRQNWGYDDTEESELTSAPNARPINFDRIPAPSVAARKPPSVDHGTTQAGKSQSNNASRRLQRCDASVLSCCNPQENRSQHQRCFVLSDCGDYFEKSNVCSNEHIQEVLDLYTAAYTISKK